VIKQQELSDPNSCLNRAAPDEPVFVLRAKDKHAAMTVRHWATMAQGTHEAERIAEARELADRMDKWRVAHQPVAYAVDQPSARP
jgi:hypothetical protein